MSLLPGFHAPSLPRPSRLLALAALALALPAGAAAQESPPDRVDVAGLVADAASGEPIAGAEVSIEDTGLRTMTNPDGRFVLRGIPRGDRTWVIERLGYATWRQSFEVEHLDQLKIGLMARPMALEAIRVTVDRLEARRRVSPYSVHTVTRSSLRSSPAIIATELVRSNMPWMPQLCPASAAAARPASGSGGVPDETSLVDPGQITWAWEDLCISYRGGTVRPRVCLDDRSISTTFLAAYGADEIYAIDYIGGPRPEVRLYTERFMESGKRLLPISMGCR